MSASLSPFEPDGSGLSAERILTLSDITLIVLCCMLALNFLIVPLLDFTRVLEVDLPQVDAEAAAVQDTSVSEVPDPVLVAQLRNPAASVLADRVALALDGRPVVPDQLPHRLSRAVHPAAQRLDFHGDASLTTQDLVSLLLLVEQSDLELTEGVQIHVRETDAR